MTTDVLSELGFEPARAGELLNDVGLKLDPQQVVTFEGSLLGAGALMSWAGNKKVGSGKMKITESSQNERIRMKLQFLKPMKAINDVQFELKPVGETRTEVVWTMSGKNEFMGKAISAQIRQPKTNQRVNRMVRARVSKRPPRRDTRKKTAVYLPCIERPAAAPATIHQRGRAPWARRTTYKTTSGQSHSPTMSGETFMPKSIRTGAKKTDSAVSTCA